MNQNGAMRNYEWEEVVQGRYQMIDGRSGQNSKSKPHPSPKNEMSIKVVWCCKWLILINCGCRLVPKIKVTPTV